MAGLSKSSLFKNIILGIINQRYYNTVYVNKLSSTGEIYQGVSFPNNNTYDVEIPAFKNGIMIKVKSIVDYDFRINDVVYVGFIDGDRQKPVILNYASYDTATGTFYDIGDLFFMDYYYHNAGRTNWNSYPMKRQLPKGVGQIHKELPTGEQLGLTGASESFRLFGYPKVYSLPNLEQYGDTLPAEFIKWDSQSIGIFNNIRYSYNAFWYDSAYHQFNYDYNNYTRIERSALSIALYTKDIAGYTATKTYETEIIYGEETECLKKITWQIYNWDNEIIDTIEYEFTYPQIFSEIALPDGFLSFEIKASTDGKIYISLIFVNLLGGTSLLSDEEECCYFYNNEEWVKVGGCEYKNYFIFNHRTFISGEGYKLLGPVYPTFYNFGNSYILSWKKDYSNPILDGYGYIENWADLGCSKIEDIEKDDIIFTHYTGNLPYNLNICSNNYYGFAYGGLNNKDLTYTIYDIDKEIEDTETITLPLSDNSSNFQIKEQVITDDNIVYFVYHDVSNSKIGVIGIDIIENEVYFSYETDCSSFPTSQKLYHYGSYIGFNNGANWVIIKGE
jgi:hypothetical protein